MANILLEAAFVTVGWILVIFTLNGFRKGKIMQIGIWAPQLHEKNSKAFKRAFAINIIIAAALIFFGIFIV